MAKADYALCMACDGKAFYDADVDYPDGVQVEAICIGCSPQYELRAFPTGNVGS